MADTPTAPEPISLGAEFAQQRAGDRVRIGDEVFRLVPVREASETEALAIYQFIVDAGVDMQRRMLAGLSRGWGLSFRDGSYYDTLVVTRLERAEMHLISALEQYRAGSVGIDEVRKRAADVANQAFMLADRERLERTRG